MNKLKDFFYNKNDIIIVLIILAVAGLIIYTRIDAIMEYPEKLADKAALQQKIEASERKATETSAPTEASSAESTAPANMTITITDSDTSVTVSEKLYQLGAVSSAADFESYISSNGKGNSIKSGTFQIPGGASQEEILKIIAN